MSLHPHTQLCWSLFVLNGQAFFADCFLLSSKLLVAIFAAVWRLLSRASWMWLLNADVARCLWLLLIVYDEWCRDCDDGVPHHWPDWCQPLFQVYDYINLVLCLLALNKFDSKIHVLDFALLVRSIVLGRLLPPLSACGYFCSGGSVAMSSR